MTATEKEAKSLVMILFLLAILIIVLVSHGYALPVIPGGKGFGMETSAGGIIRVANLNAGGKGSLRAAIDAQGPKVLIFEVSGNIEINGRLTIHNSFVTIAGQTAPGPGIG